jgi:hypothetical protein
LQIVNPFLFDFPLAFGRMVLSGNVKLSFERGHR